MEYGKIISHKVGSKAQLKEVERCWDEFEEIAFRIRNQEQYEGDFEKLIELAESEYGSPLQVMTIGKLYLHDIGVSPSRKIAEKWFQKAKKKGNDLICLELSTVYAELKDIDEFISCLRRAKWHGSKLAARMLDYMEKHPFEAELPQA